MTETHDQHGDADDAERQESADIPSSASILSGKSAPISSTKLPVKTVVFQGVQRYPNERAH